MSPAPPPPDLVRGCDSPEGVRVLADWLDEHGLDGSEFREPQRDVAEMPFRGQGEGFASGRGCGYGGSDGNGEGDGGEYGFSDGEGDGDGGGYSTPDGDGGPESPGLAGED